MAVMVNTDKHQPKVVTCTTVLSLSVSVSHSLTHSLSLSLVNGGVDDPRVRQTVTHVFPFGSAVSVNGGVNGQIVSISMRVATLRRSYRFSPSSPCRGEGKPMGRRWPRI